MPSQVVYVLLDGAPVGRGALTINRGRQRMHRLPSLGGRTAIVPGRREPDSAVLALDAEASSGFHSGANRVEVMADDGDRAVLHVERASGSLGAMTLYGFLQ